MLTNAKYPLSPGAKEHLAGPVIRKRRQDWCNVTILPGVVVGENALVGAGAVVANDVPSWCSRRGQPGTRDSTGRRISRTQASWKRKNVAMQTLDTVTSIEFVDLKAQYQSIKTEIDTAMATVIASATFIGGPWLKTFEQEFARYCGTTHCVGVANGTDALYIALRTLGIGPGDEVITVANSFIATSEAIRMAGARVVFVDINPETYNIDVSAD